ncbi:CsbD family protein [Arthrobacter sp. 2MCAF15]|uniref:CsbD family protein n=1 Tax=Arthrobacter sp. 2MCAF15 TaxID=3232984 RepID=UPI003F8EE92C
MGTDDKANLTVIHHIGAAKEGAGRMTGNQDLRREGQHEQAQAKLQEAGERVKDAAADIGGNIQDAARKLRDGFSKE